MRYLGDRRQARWTARCVGLFRVLALVALLAACSGPQGERADPTATGAISPSPTGTSVGVAPSATPTSRGATPTNTASPTAPATATPTLAATATLPPTNTPELQPTATPDPRPADQALGIPDIVAHYRLEISSVSVDTGEVVATEVVEVREIRGERPARLYFQVTPAAYGFFTLDGASLGGAPAAPEALNAGSTLALDLPADLATPFEVGFAFRLAVGPEASGWGGTARDGEVLRLGYWFPVISDDHGFSTTFDPSYTRVASFAVEVVHDADVTIAHTGQVVERLALDDGRVRTVMHAENVRDFAMTLARGYQVDSGFAANGVAIELYSLPSSERNLSDAEAVARRGSIIAWAADAVEQLSGLLGPYPYDTLRLADAGPSMPGGVEFPHLIYINPNYVPLDRLIYHETAHQWLYGIIGNRTLLDGWIDEGGAEFFERGLPTGFTERPAPPEGGYVYWLDATYHEVEGGPRLPFYYAIYEQGANFYYDVLETMGWDAFWGAMREVYNRFRFGIVTPWDMLTTWQRHSSVDLRPLYRAYFRYTWIDAIADTG